MLPQRNVEMIAELVNWLRRSLTSRRSLRPTEPGNSEEPDPEVLISVPKSDKTGIAEGQLSLEIGDLVSACTTEADLSQKVQAMSKSNKFAYLRQNSKPDPQFKFPLDNRLITLRNGIGNAIHCQSFRSRMT
eukprot:Em0003g216a